MHEFHELLNGRMPSCVATRQDMLTLKFHLGNVSPPTGQGMEEKLMYRFRCGQSDSEKNNPHNISVTANTDGVALIKSSKISIWPIYMVINELPPKERYVDLCV